jgi:hypothetical protein
VSPLLGSAWAAAERLGGKPKILFTFVVGTRMWRYVQGNADVTVLRTGLTYTAAQIQVDGDTDRRDDLGPQRIAVRIGIRAEVVDALRTNQTEACYLGIHRYHVSAGSESANPARWAFGNIANVRVTRGWCTLELQTEEAYWENLAPRAILSTHCQKDTYSAECGVDPDAFATACNVTAAVGAAVTVDSVGGRPDDYFSFGILKIGNQFWHVPKQVGTAVTIFGALPRGLTLPAAATLYAGDDLTHETCRDKFDNLDEFLGFKWLPTSNPLDNLESHGGPDALIAFVPHVPPLVGYTTPAQFGLWDAGIGVTTDVAGNVSNWADQSGNGRDLSQTDPTRRPGYDGSGAMGLGPSSVELPYGHSGIGGAATWFDGPDLSSLSQIDAFLAFNSVEDPAADIRSIISMVGSGAAVNAFLLYPFPENHITDGTFLSAAGAAPFNYRPPISLRGGRHVLNWTATADRYTVRLDGQVIFTTTPQENGYGIGLNSSGNTLGKGGSFYWLGALFAFLIYPRPVDDTDRATTTAFMMTGTGSPA